jgi:hypothetical protein
MSTVINIAPSSDLTVGTTAVTSGTNGRVLFQAGGVVQQDSAFFWDNTNKRLGVGATPASTVRLDIRAQGALSTDIAFRVRNSADTFDLLSINGVGLISGRTDGAGGFNMNYQGTPNTTVQLAFNNGNPTLRVAQNTGGHAFNVYASTDNREYLAGLIGKATFAIGANPLAGAIKPNEANTNTMYVFNGTAPTLSATDSFNLYSADRGGTAGRASAHFRSEDGTINVLGDLSGIGTSTPAARLDVRAQGALSTDIAFRVRNSADTQNLFSLSGNGNFTLGLANSYYISLNPSSPSLRGYNSTNVAWQLSPWTGEHCWLTNVQSNQVQVGIGITTPTSKLHVYTNVDDTSIKIGTGASLVANETACLKFSTTNAGTSAGQDALIIRARSKGTTSGDQKCSAEFSLNRNGTTALKASITSQSNLLLQAPTEDTNDIGVIYIPNGTAPTANLAGGGKLYVEGGALKYRGSSGTISVIAPA